MNRYDFKICNCSLGPHIDSEKSNNGDWVRYDDIETIKEKIQSMPTHKKLVDGEYVDCIKLIDVLNLFDK